MASHSECSLHNSSSSSSLRSRSSKSEHQKLSENKNANDEIDSIKNRVTTAIENNGPNLEANKKLVLDEAEVKRFELFHAVIDREDDLLNQRVSWIILAQSFLMAAYITSSSTDTPDCLRYITAFVGLATVIVTMPAILAAGRNIEIQQQVYFAQIESDERCMQLHGHTRDLSFCNPMESQQRMTQGHILPNMAYRSRKSVPIIYTAGALAIVQCAGWIFLLIALAMEWT